VIKVTKDKLIHKLFELPEGCSVKSFVVREIDGADEREAGRWLAAAGSSVDDMGLAIMDEQLRISIVGVDGETVEQPYTGMDAWSAKTRRFLLEAFSLLNGVKDDEVAIFLGAAKDLNNSDQPAAEVLSDMELKKALSSEG